MVCSLSRAVVGILEYADYRSDEGWQAISIRDESPDQARRLQGLTMLILLSPSKTQETGHGQRASTMPQMLGKTEELVARLRRLDSGEIGRLMAVSEKLAQSATQRYRRFRFPPRIQDCSPALLAFRGDVFSEIDADSYSDRDFDFAQRHLRILSGLYGILRPLDLIQPYRLEMAGRFRTAEGASLYQYWRDDVTAALKAALAEEKHSQILNLASAEYFKVIDRTAIPVPIVDVFFQQRRKAQLKTIAIHAKKARGALCNHIISNRLESSSALGDFHYQGYCFDEQLSSDTELLYIRDELE